MAKETITARLTYQRKDKDGVYLKQSYHKTYTNKGVKFYFGWQHVFTKVSKTSFSVLIYLAEHMNKATNEITVTETTIRNYIEFRQRCGMTKCSEAVVRKAIQQLKTHHVLIKTVERANYIVNPRYLFYEDGDVRRVTINRLLENTKDPQWGATNLEEALFLNMVDDI